MSPTFSMQENLRLDCLVNQRVTAQDIGLQMLLFASYLLFNVNIVMLFKVLQIYAINAFKFFFNFMHFYIMTNNSLQKLFEIKNVKNLRCLT